LFDAFSDFLNGFLILAEESRPLEAVYSFAYAIHKAPIAYYTCDLTLSDYSLIVNFYNTFVLSAPDTWGTYVVTIFWNVFFNWVDIMYEWIILVQVNEEREWTTIGEYMAKIVSDVFFKSPITRSWNYRNSDVLNEEWGEPLDLYYGGIREINSILTYYGYDPLMEPEGLQNLP